MARQNIYDDEAFFAGCQVMRAPRSGINEAVEQPALRSLLPPVDGCFVVDLGCGDGQLCRDLVDRGADTAIGVAPSERMLAVATQRTVDRRISYRRDFLEDVALPAGSVDLVVSSLALHYVADLPAVMNRAATWLRPRVVHRFYRASRRDRRTGTGATPVRSRQLRRWADPVADA